MREISTTVKYHHFCIKKVSNAKLNTYSKTNVRDKCVLN